MRTFDKAAVLSSIQARLKADLDDVTGSQLQIIAGATHSESRAENDKDTRALESTYLARGLARRVGQLREAVAQMAVLQIREFGTEDPVALGAVVELQADDGEARCYFLAPAAGGMELKIGDREVQVVTPSSPIGRSILGKHVGDEVDVRTPQGRRESTVTRLG